MTVNSYRNNENNEEENEFDDPWRSGRGGGQPWWIASNNTDPAADPSQPPHPPPPHHHPHHPPPPGYFMPPHPPGAWFPPPPRGGVGGGRGRGGGRGGRSGGRGRGPPGPHQYRPIMPHFMPPPPGGHPHHHHPGGHFVPPGMMMMPPPHHHQEEGFANIMMMMPPPPPPPPPPRVPVPPLEPQALPETQQELAPNHETGNKNDDIPTCTLCMEICLQEPHGCDNDACTARFCAQCVERLMYAAPPTVPLFCPVCRTTTSRFAVDTALQQALQARPGGTCKFDACEASFPTFPALVEHQSTCPHEKVACRFATVGCSWTGTRQDCTTQHDTTDCPFRHFHILVQRQLQTQATLEAHVAHLHGQLSAAGRDVMELRAAVHALQQQQAGNSNGTADPSSSPPELN